MTTQDDVADVREQQSRPSVGELLGQISSDVSTLMRQEVELAKAEVRESAAKAGAGAGMLAGAGVAANLALVFVSVAVWWALGEVIGRGWSALVVAVVWAVVAAVLAAVGRNRIRSVTGVPRTTETVSKIPRAMKGEETP
jgi:uncharacterized membrane protein YqjE